MTAELTSYHLPPQRPEKEGVITLVLDLDETLVHSVFRKAKCDYRLKINVEGNVQKVYVKQRPGAKELIRDLADKYEIVVYTASLSVYAKALMKLFDLQKLSITSFIGSTATFEMDRLLKTYQNWGETYLR